MQSLPAPGKDFTSGLIAAGNALIRLFVGIWRVLHFGAIALVITLSPSTHDRACRRETARQICLTTWQVLPGFALLSALISLVLIRIVAVTAVSYGLSQYALEMMVRVLVLELIPLFAALFIALRFGVMTTTEIATLRLRKELRTQPEPGGNPWRHVLVPRILGCTFSVLTLAAVSSTIALIIAYLGTYGLSPWGLPAFTRAIGQVFDLAVSIGFLLKVVFFSLAVGIMPVAASLEARTAAPAGRSFVIVSAVRLLLVLIVIEAASLSVKYV